MVTIPTHTYSVPDMFQELHWTLNTSSASYPFIIADEVAVMKPGEELFKIRELRQSVCLVCL